MLTIGEDAGASVCLHVHGRIHVDEPVGGALGRVADGGEVRSEAAPGVEADSTASIKELEVVLEDDAVPRRQQGVVLLADGVLDIV